jgi:hypothetical protein
MIFRFRQVEHQDAAGILGGDVVVNVSVHRVLDLDAGDVVFGAAVAHDDVLRLADIDARVGRTRNGHAVDQHVLGFDRIDPIGPVGRKWTPSPDHLQVLVGDIVGTLGFDAVTLGVLHRETGQRDAVRSHQQALARALLFLEGDDGLVDARAAEGYIVDIEREALGEVERALGQLDHIARLGVLQARLQLGVGLSSRRNWRRFSGVAGRCKRQN